VDTVCSWQCRHKFRAIPPLFQGTPSHLVECFEDLQEFHKGVVNVLKAADAFMGQILYTMPVLSIFYEDFKLVELCLKEIGTKIADFKRSSGGNLTKYQDQVDKLNLILKPLVNDSLICFGPQKPEFIWQDPPKKIEHLYIQDGGLSVSKTSGCCHTIIHSDIGWKRGVHVWYVKVGVCACYDTIGVCDETYFGENKQLPLGLGTYPGDQRDKDGAGIKFIGDDPTEGLEKDTVIKCKLDMDAKTFSFQRMSEYITRPLSEKQTITITDHGLTGERKIYPALVLCHNSTYKLVRPNFELVWEKYLEFFFHKCSWRR